MLRFDHMPSDFNEIFLFLGNREELMKLARLLRDFSDDPREIDIRAALPDAGGSSQLSLMPAEGTDAPYGLRMTGDKNHFNWVLNGWIAGQIALRVDALTAEDLKSGNDILELGLEGEIPVKISRGEFTDNFLTPKHHLHPDYVPDSDTDQH